MKLSIIIVNYNVKYFLEQCLTSILASQFDSEYEVIIVDNNSTDNSLPYLKSRFTQPNIYYLANDHNSGFATANNQAIRQARGEYILLLNPDTVLGENVLSNVCRFMDNKPESGAVGVKMINGYGTFLPESKRGFPTLWASFCKISGLAAIFPKSGFFGKYNLRYLDENKVHQVPILAGAFMMIRRAALDKAGLLDEAFFMYGEDIDLSYRITKAGYNNYYLPEKIIHYKGESTDKNDKKYTEAFYGAMRIFFKKHYPNHSKIYNLFISAGISIASLFRHTQSDTPTFDIIDCDASQNSYEEIIEKMDNCNNKNVQFRIFTPKTGMVIGTHYAKPKE